MNLYPSDIVYTPVHADTKLIDQTVFPEKYKRELLRIKFKNKNKDTITFIMMNPSKATSTHMDDTIENIIKFLSRTPLTVVNNKHLKIKDIGTLEVVNLFPFYRTNSAELKSDIETLQSHLDSGFFTNLINSNHETIKRSIVNAKYIVLAWGLPTLVNYNIYFNEIIKTLDFVREQKKKFIFTLKTNGREALSKFGNPYHPVAKTLEGLVSCDISKHNEIIVKGSSK
ncbi:DUF1643 domain-containing protein [Bacillus cereus group sp. Bc015]|uniref:DUF1643 domain-containing protein n=1 Tax=Bacillus cereus group sp. Bc015 TaxID=3018123 RepID=UPI0022E79E08|nr:DUF1643 domain-containing protein [Bacillus cereus group sp. Bc015]MDA2738038.1 DUF1643 domain-containing protein [Bacillus cereus group sp. Bc015]